jgi:hypothetical protein
MDLQLLYNMFSEKKDRKEKEKAPQHLLLFLPPVTEAV